MPKKHKSKSKHSHHNNTAINKTHVHIHLDKKATKKTKRKKKKPKHIHDLPIRTYSTGGIPPNPLPSIVNKPEYDMKPFGIGLNKILDLNDVQNIQRNNTLVNSALHNPLTFGTSTPVQPFHDPDVNISHSSINTSSYAPTEYSSVNSWTGYSVSSGNSDYSMKELFPDQQSEPFTIVNPLHLEPESKPLNGTRQELDESIIAEPKEDRRSKFIEEYEKRMKKLDSEIALKSNAIEAWDDLKAIVDVKPDTQYLTEDDKKKHKIFLKLNPTATSGNTQTIKGLKKQLDTYKPKIEQIKQERAKLEAEKNAEKRAENSRSNRPTVSKTATLSSLSSGNNIGGNIIDDSLVSKGSTFV
jgi:hypothetical protein